MKYFDEYMYIDNLRFSGSNTLEPIGIALLQYDLFALLD